MLFDGGMQHSVNFFTLLFSIKGQTVQNSTVIPHTLCSHLTPVSFFTQHYHVTAQFLHQSYQHGSCKFNASLHYNQCDFLCFSRVLTIRLYFLPPRTANQKAASGAGRLSGEGGDPDVSAVCQCEFVYFKRHRQNSRLICMITCCQRAFMGSLSKLWKEYKSSRRPLIPFLYV